MLFTVYGKDKLIYTVYVDRHNKLAQELKLLYTFILHFH